MATKGKEARDLLKKLLTIDPSERITALQAQTHPFFNKENFFSPKPDPNAISDCFYNFKEVQVFKINKDIV